MGVSAGGEQDRDDARLARMNPAQRRVKRCFGGLAVPVIGIGAGLDEELAQLPMTMESRAVEVEIVAETFQGSAVRQKQAQGADVAIISAPADERDAAGVGGARLEPGGQPIVDAVGPAGGNLVQQPFGL